MKYVYSGPTSGATLDAGADGIVEVMFFDGKEVDLPETNEYVKTLVALGHLKEKEIGHIGLIRPIKEVTKNAS